VDVLGLLEGLEALAAQFAAKAGLLEAAEGAGSRRATSCSSSQRLPAVVRAQPGQASRAAATAASTCSGEAAGTSTIVSVV
jgi:hypothetical protein